MWYVPPCADSTEARLAPNLAVGDAAAARNQIRNGDCAVTRESAATRITAMTSLQVLGNQMWPAEAKYTTMLYHLGSTHQLMKNTS
jgi:hypothetical protein